MEFKTDFNMIVWGILISLITLGVMMILGITSSNPAEIVLKLIIAISIPVATIVLLSLARRMIHK